MRDTKTAAAHTPGPWVVDDGAIETADGTRDIAVVKEGLIWHPDTEHAEANARLIAAAPTLYEAAWAVSNVYTWRSSAEGADAMKDAVKQLRRALELAERLDTKSAASAARSTDVST